MLYNNQFKQHKPSDSFSLINNAFPSSMSQLPSFDMTNSSNFMQLSFSSENHSSPSTPHSLNVMLNQQHHNSPSSPSLNALNANENIDHIMPNIDLNHFNHFQMNNNHNNHLIHDPSKRNPLLNSQYNNDSDEDDFINWENLL